ncbi:hypothetical protein BH11ARM1_BH11ARM1_10290 [soil metagenome]
MGWFRAVISVIEPETYGFKGFWAIAILPVWVVAGNAFINALSLPSASSSGKWDFYFMLALSIVIAVFGMLTAKNEKVILDANGIRYYDKLGRLAISAAYNQIRDVSVVQRRYRRINITTDNGTISCQSIGNLDGLAQRVKQFTGHF